MEHEGNGGNIDSSSSGVKGSFLCRQSSSRWTPTTDQIRILKELYYNDGVRSPSAEQIQRISADLRRYGKIEGKNVFYWFQNHKARERQKRRFTHPPPPNPAPPRAGFSASSGAAQSSSGVLALGYASSVTMEKSFRDCSISSAGGHSNNVGGGQYEYGWGGFGHHPYTTTTSFFDKRNASSSIHHHREAEVEIQGHVEDDDHRQEIETLPLFPTHREDMTNGSFCGYVKHGASAPSSTYAWYGSSDHYNGAANSFASLELSLNSFTAHSSDMF